VAASAYSVRNDPIVSAPEDAPFNTRDGSWAQKLLIELVAAIRAIWETRLEGESAVVREVPHHGISSGVAIVQKEIISLATPLYRFLHSAPRRCISPLAKLHPMGAPFALVLAPGHTVRSVTIVMDHPETSVARIHKNPNMTDRPRIEHIEILKRRVLNRIRAPIGVDCEDSDQQP